MKSEERWILPAGVEEVLSEEAWLLEAFRSQLLSFLDSYGYDLVRPPLMEYLESLLTGTGQDLDIQTFKITDQYSGRMMGIRSDMTPQVARIEAHYLKQKGPVRLCYCGPTLLARTDALGSTREPLQFGAELFGNSGTEGDGEIIELMVKAMQLLGVEDIHVNLGHVGIFREIIRHFDFNPVFAPELFEILQKKSVPDLDSFAVQYQLDRQLIEILRQLLALNGDQTVLASAYTVFDPEFPGIVMLLDELKWVTEFIGHNLSNIPVHLDLAELRGYHYHTGMVFSLLAPGFGHEIAKGGRYDDIGKSFGYARPATGFSADLRQIIKLVHGGRSSRRFAIAAPAQEDRQLKETIASLRQQGERVICRLPQQSIEELRISCDRQLVMRAGKWQVEAGVDGS